MAVIKMSMTIYCDESQEQQFRTVLTDAAAKCDLDESYVKIPPPGYANPAEPNDRSALACLQQCAPKMTKYKMEFSELYRRTLEVSVPERVSVDAVRKAMIQGGIEELGGTVEWDDTEFVDTTGESFLGRVNE